MTNIVVLGAGLAGMSAAYHLNGTPMLLEREERVGGILRCTRIDGFTFDRAPHLLYSKNEYAKELIQKVLLRNQYSERRRSSWVFSKGTFTKYPFQANQYGLPIEMVKECILGLIEAKYELKIKPTNFKEWCLATFGSGIAHHFMIPYNEKLWAIPLEKMDFSWIAERVPMPKIEDVLDGALHLQEKDFGPNALFWYPKKGGIETLAEGLRVFLANIRLNAEITCIDVERKEAVVNGCEKISYDHLISSLPLNRFVDLIRDAPQEVKDAAQRLEYNRVHVVMIGFDRESEIIGDKHWAYFPEKEFIFYRLTFMRNFASDMVPRGCDSVIAEISESRHRPLETDNVITETVKGLRHIGVLKKSDSILVKRHVVIDPAYIIYTHDHSETVGIIHRYLKSKDIICCGRFGEWEYFNMDQAILSGKHAAKRVQETLG